MLPFDVITLSQEQLEYLDQIFRSQPFSKEDFQKYLSDETTREISMENKLITDKLEKIYDEGYEEREEQERQWDELFKELGFIAEIPHYCELAEDMDGFNFVTMNGLAYLTKHGMAVR